MKQGWIVLVLALACPAMARAEGSVNLRAAYFFDDTANELSQRFLADEREPQASLLGLGATYRPDSDWVISLSGLWGRGNERYRDTHLVRQDDELLVQRDIAQHVAILASYRYEYTGVRTDGDGRLTDIGGGREGALLSARENQVRHSVRAGVSVDLPILPRETTAADARRSNSSSPPRIDSPHHALASLAAVVARGRNSLTYVVDTDPGPGSREQFRSLGGESIWRAGPELTLGYMYYFNEKVAFDVRYRGAFLFDRVSTSTHVNAIHGVTLSFSYIVGGHHAR